MTFDTHVCFDGIEFFLWNLAVGAAAILIDATAKYFIQRRVRR